MLKESDLIQFTGTENWYRHTLTGFTYTDGVKYVAETAGAYWLIDAILISMRYDKKLSSPRYEGFVVWKLNVDLEKKSASLLCEDGNYNLIYSQEIKYTDFPLKSIGFFFENSVLILPSEH